MRPKTSLLAIIAAVVLVFFAIALAIILIIRPTPAGPADERFGLEGSDLSASVIMDRVSGVYYLVIQSGGSVSVTPLLNLDGLPLCVDDINHGDLESGLADVRGNMQRYMGGVLSGR